MAIRTAALPVLVSLAAVAAVLGLLGSRGEASRAPDAHASAAGPTLLDRRLADFREDEGSDRIVALLEAVLSRDDDGTTLTIHASALGPRLDGPPGFEGVRGANRIAAREIASILAEGRAEVRVAGPAGATSRGRALAGRRGAVLERRLLADGRVEHAPAGGAERLVEAVFDARLEGDGTFAVEVLVDGRARARASVRVSAAGGRILALEGVADHGATGSRP